MSSREPDGPGLRFTTELGDPKSLLKLERDPLTGALTDASSLRSDKSEVREVRFSSSSTGPPRSRPKWLIPVAVVVIVAVGTVAAIALGGGNGSTETTQLAGGTPSTVGSPTSTLQAGGPAVTESTAEGQLPVASLLGFEGAYEFVSQDLVVLNTAGVWAAPGTEIEIAEDTVSYVNTEALRNGSFSFAVDGPAEVEACSSDSCVLTLSADPFPRAISLTPAGLLYVVDFMTMEQRGEFCGFPVRVEEGMVEPTYGSDGITVESFRYVTSFGSGSGGDGCEDAVEISLTLIGTRVP